MLACWVIRCSLLLRRLSFCSVFCSDLVLRGCHSSVTCLFDHSQQPMNNLLILNLDSNMAQIPYFGLNVLHGNNIEIY